MSAMQRTKGAVAERWVAGLIRDWTGFTVKRNWQGQAAEGGEDLTGVPGWAIEVKRAKEYQNSWWRQTVEQAKPSGRYPVLIYLIDQTRRGQNPLDRWRVLMPLGMLMAEAWSDEETAEISLRAWLQYISANTERPTKTDEETP